MKRLLAIAGLALGIGLAVSSAQAAPLQTVVKGGVTCSQYSTGFASFPTTYWDCVTPANPTGAESSIGGAANSLQTAPTNLKASLANVQIYTFVNAAQYHSFTGNAAPAANAFGATGTNLAAAFSSATQNGAAVNLTNAYTGSIVQELGHLVDAAQVSPYSGNAVFTTALAYDIVYLNAQGKNVWPAAYYTKYPNDTNWQILQAIYPNAATDIFDYQFQQNNGDSSTTADLTQALSYMPNTKGWVKNYVYLSTPTNPAAAAAGVMCVRWSTGSATFPTVYFDCVNPYNTQGVETSIINNALQLLPTNLGVQLLAAKVGIYAMLDITKFDSYFTATPPVSLANVFGNSSTSIKVSAAFMNTFTNANGTGPVANPVIPGTMVHELGHQFDALWGNPSQKTGAGTFGGAIAADLACTANTCINGTGVTCFQVFQTQATCNAYPGLTNSQILAKKYGSSAAEQWAEVFEHNESDSAQFDLESALHYLPSTNAFMQAVLAKAVPNGSPN